MSATNFAPLSPTSELEAVNIILSGIGEAPVNTLNEATSDVSMARHVLMEIAREVQLEGFQWNTEDNYPLKPDAEDGHIHVGPPIIRVHFREPDARELVIRGKLVYDRVRHSYVFDPATLIQCTVTLFLPFEDMSEAARRYVTIKALRVFQERVVGSSTLSQFQQADEARARVQLMSEERKLDRPNMLKGTLAPTGTWLPVMAVAGRRNYRGVY